MAAPQDAQNLRPSRFSNSQFAHRTPWRSPGCSDRIREHPNEVLKANANRHLRRFRPPLDIFAELWRAAYPAREAETARYAFGVKPTDLRNWRVKAA
jgi:hypothetical protein